MRRIAVWIIVGCCVAMGGTSRLEAADQEADRAAIEKAIASYTAAFNARDAGALAAHWGPEAVYTNPQGSYCGVADTSALPGE